MGGRAGSVTEDGCGGGLGGGGVVALECVGVDLHGDGGVGVADPFADDLHRAPGTEGEHAPGVFQAVDPYSGQTGGIDAAGEHLRGALGRNGRAVGTREHPHCVAGPDGDAPPGVGQGGTGGLGWYPRSSYRIWIGYDHQNFTAWANCGAERRVTVQGWAQPGPQNPHSFDYGGIQLDCSTSHGHLGYWWSDSDSWQHARNYGLLSGHPGGEHQVMSEGYRTAQTSRRLFYDNPSAGGTSGGPRWNTSRTSCGHCAHAIHGGRFGGDGRGVLISSQVFDNLYRWKHEGW